MAVKADAGEAGKLRLALTVDSIRLHRRTSSLNSDRSSVQQGSAVAAQATVTTPRRPNARQIVPTHDGRDPASVTGQRAPAKTVKGVDANEKGGSAVYKGARGACQAGVMAATPMCGRGAKSAGALSRELTVRRGALHALRTDDVQSTVAARLRVMLSAMLQHMCMGDKLPPGAGAAGELRDGTAVHCMPAGAGGAALARRTGSARAAEGVQERQRRLAMQEAKRRGITVVY